ncbi:hypothetical protein MXMO3_03482 (plasmid) [Maritalea myrionectae]|uniref:Uncharacterized protein n=1 Tax=Maritalea myrionectae TaxID=454601 RepID=A0A2R4MJ05_9HYPH|nr:hypothetical protein [Maritalea myrionectae]AVX05985.1 hypothetical protein MXMO3_03482 [Maritalea myrionectae]
MLKDNPTNRPRDFYVLALLPIVISLPAIFYAFIWANELWRKYIISPNPFDVSTVTGVEVSMTLVKLGFSMAPIALLYFVFSVQFRLYEGFKSFHSQPSVVSVIDFYRRVFKRLTNDVRWLGIALLVLGTGKFIIFLARYLAEAISL